MQHVNIKCASLLVLLCTALCTQALTAKEELNAALELDGGTTLHKQLLPMGDHDMQVWIYLPAESSVNPLPLVLIAPAGSNMVTGMPLADGDSQEHIPYAQAGYAVVAYSISYDLADDAEGSAQAAALDGFRQFEGGVKNAGAALDYMLRVLGHRIDTDKIYAAGHSSAATLALQLTAKEARIKACAAYAPSVDFAAWFGSDLETVNKVFPGYTDWLMAMSPDRLMDQLSVPIFLFVAEDDSVTSATSVKTFAKQLEMRDVNTTLETVPTGDHYYPMLETGIPLAIKWLGQFSGIEAESGD